MQRNPYLSGFENKPKKRKSIRTSDRKHLLEFQKGKCKECDKSFKIKKVRPILHHKNLNPKDNRICNMILLCPDCHDKIHQKEKKVRKKRIGQWGETIYKVVKVKSKKKTSKKKITKRKTINKRKLDNQIDTTFNTLLGGTPNTKRRR